MKFIDLFSGIGGFHIALESLGHECVMACEKDKYARETYITNFGEKFNNQDVFPHDITQLDANKIPDFDILCAGFPCQAFSGAGHRKGFNDTRGTLFFDVARIANTKRPQYIILENVRNLVSHDSGKTFNVIINTLKEIGYTVYYQVLCSADYGVPQMRKRIYIVCSRDGKKYEFPNPIKLKMTMSDIFNGECKKDVGYTLRCGGRNSPIDDRHNWDGYIVDGHERRINIKEALMMQGFPESYKFPVSEAQAMKQLGNSVSVPVIRAIVEQIR